MEIFGLITSLLFLASIIILIIKATKDKAKPKPKPFKKTSKLASPLETKTELADKYEKSIISKEIKETVKMEKFMGESDGDKSTIYKISLTTEYSPENLEENLETVFGVKRYNTLQTFRSSHSVLANGDKFGDSNDSIEFFRAELIENMLLNDEVSMAVELLKSTEVNVEDFEEEIIEEQKHEVSSENFTTSITMKKLSGEHNGNKIMSYDISVSEYPAINQLNSQAPNVINAKRNTKKANASFVYLASGDKFQKKNGNIDYYYAQIVEKLLKDGNIPQAIEILLSTVEPDLILGGEWLFCWLRL